MEMYPYMSLYLMYTEMLRCRFDEEHTHQSVTGR